MILVVGATGLLGSEISRRLASAGQAVRGIVRATSSRDRVQALQSVGVETVIADLKDPQSLARACEGVSAVIATASSTISRQEGDSIETVDRCGYLNLVDWAKCAGVERFIYISIPLHQAVEFPLAAIKRKVERAVVESGICYTLLRANYFMEIWLSPMLGFDYTRGRATIYGNGEGPSAWVSYRDVAGFAVDALGNEAARNRAIEVGGPENLSPHQVVRAFEQESGHAFELSHIPEKVLRDRYADAADPLAKSLAGLRLGYAHGNPMDMGETLGIMPRRLTLVREYAAAVGKTT